MTEMSLFTHSFVHTVHQIGIISDQELVSKPGN